jgi:hypothetical protein
MTRSGFSTRFPLPGPVRPVVAAIALLAALLAGCDAQGGQIEEIVPPATPRLTAPADGSNDTENAVQLVWTAVEPGTIYEVVIARDAAFQDLVVTVSDLQSPSYVVTGLEVGREYCWRVRARNEAGTSDWTGDWTFTPAREVVIAAVPQPVWPPHNQINLPEEVTVEWTPIEGALSYDLQLAQEDIFVRRDADMTAVAGPTQELIGLVKGYEYFWRIRSRNHAGVSAWSPVWRFVVVNNPDDPNGPR